VEPTVEENAMWTTRAFLPEICHQYNKTIIKMCTHTYGEASMSSLDFSLKCTGTQFKIKLKRKVSE